MGLETLYRDIVEADEIDTLGHMNIRHYGIKSHRAVLACFAAHGLDRDALDASGLRVVITDGFIRYHREQRQGARIEFRGGPIEIDINAVTLYIELVDTATDEMGATFAYRARLAPHDKRSFVALPDDFRKAVAAKRIEWPAHGRPRSVPFDPIRKLVTRAEIEAHGLRPEFDFVVPAWLCDKDGFLAASPAVSAAWMTKGDPGNCEKGPPLSTTGDGRKVAWANLETRATWFSRVREGDRLVCYLADVEYGRKTRLFRHWIFDGSTGGLVSMFQAVGVLFDVGARKAAEIPPEILDAHRSSYFPSLR